MRKAIALAGLTGAVISAGITFAATAEAGLVHSSYESPPECVHTTITDNSGAGPKLWVVWCGMGVAGESPMTDGGKSLTVDGGALNARSCTRLSPCYVMWPASPREV